MAAQTKRRWRTAIALVHLAGVMLLTAAPARADSRAELEKARASFLARNWTDAEERLRALLDPKTGAKERSVLSQARMYLGAILLQRNEPEAKAEAKKLYERLVLDDPSFDPDPLSFPSEAINTYIDVHSDLLEQIRKASEQAAQDEAKRRRAEAAKSEAERVWLEKLQLQASEEQVTVKHSRIVASIPFGVGQFQNGQTPLGIVFLSAEVAAIAGTAVTFWMYNYAREREREETAGVNGLAPQWHARAEDLRLVNLGFVGGFLVAAAIGIAQANFAFVPDSSETRRRTVPPQPSLSTALAPIVSPLSGRNGAPNGVFVGLRALAF